MDNRVFGFASPAIASRHPSTGTGAHASGPWRRAILCLAAVALMAATNGCSWLGWVPGMGHDDAIDMPKNAGQAVDAMTAVQLKIQAAPNEPYWRFHQAELYEASDSTTQAVASLKAALAIDPAYAPAASLLSKIYYRSGLYADGVALLNDVLARDPHAPDALRADLALHLDAMGELDQAATTIASCTGDPRETDAARAYVTLRGNDPKSAMDAARRAVEADGKSAVNHNNYGVALLHAGHPVEARESFKKALELDDHLPGALYNMAIVEAFYFFDDDAGRGWYARYKQVSKDDPDDLESVLGTDVTRLSRDKKQ